jgi:hypothetical protein
MSSRSRPRLLPLLQTVAAGAAVFAILGACGIPVNHPQRPRYQRVQPIVVRLSGTWDAVPIGESAPRPLRLTLRHAGARVDGVLNLPDRDLPAEWPGRIDRGGRFSLVFGRPPEQTRINLQIEVRGRRLSGTYVGPRGAEPVTFLRH